MIWCGGGDVLCASTWWDHRESNNLQHPVYNIRWQIRDSSPHHPIHFWNQHIKTMFLKHFSGLKKEDSERLLTLRTNSFNLFSYLPFIGIQRSFDIFWTEKQVVPFVFTFFYETAPIYDISTRQICDSGHKFVILCCKFCQNITLTGSTHCIQRLTFANNAYNYSIVTFVTFRPVATNTL